MAKKKPTTAAKESDAAEIPADVATTVEEAAAKPAAETITKAGAVRRALMAGMDNPTEGVAYVKSQYGLDMTTAMFSTYKGMEKKRAEGGKPARAAKEEVAEPEAKPSGKAAKGDTVEFVRQVKDLVDQYGVEAVKDLAQVFAK